MTRRIANLLGLGAAGRGFDVPSWAVGSDFASEVVETRAPVSFINDLDHTVSDLTYAEAALRAERSGFAAAFINTAGDYGLRQARSIVSIPVVGSGQAAMQLAVGLGRHFGIVTVWPPLLRTMYERLLMEYGFQDHCASLRFVTGNEELIEMVSEDGHIEQMRSGQQQIIDRIEQVANRSIQDGADVIVLGCTCMSPIRDELEKRVNVPVIDPLVTGHKYAEMLVALDVRMANPMVSSIQSAVLEAIVEAAGSGVIGPSTEEECGDACEVISESSG